ncbi:amidase [Piscinibacter sp. XHJ-5]|uniref:amidase n=1 Tax=Piscinibacter sp. XHJ-5 TaxID=3037797 RepID=UPI002452F075|nr:amidase [Piscinibacter sp. XHJ-5]
MPTTREIVAALQSRQVSSMQLVEQAIARIEADDARINAVVVRDFVRARAAAAAADQALARGERRPLLGVPITVKEAFNVAGLPTTWGIPGTQHIPVNEDAVAVARLKAAGAVLLGKTNVALLLADWQTSNEVYGTTNNPWDPGRTPGGSSGGGAAALAAGFVSLEMGSDLAGSLRVPAHCCGVFAHKPTHGLVPLRGFAPPGTPSLSVGVDVDLAVAGPMARSAADLALALDVLAGPDEQPAVAYRLALPPPRHDALKDHRVFVVDQHPMVPTSQAVRSALDGVVERLAQQGARIGRQSGLLPDVAQVTTLWARLLFAFSGADMPEDDYRRARSAAGDDPSAALAMSHRDWIHADRERVAVAHQWRQFFGEWDVLLCPVLPTPAFVHDHRPMEQRRLEVDGKSIRYTEQSMWLGLATLTGLPSTTMPIGLGDEGLPIGMQIVGPFLEDRTTLAFAQALERELGPWRSPPPPG